MDISLDIPTLLSIEYPLVVKSAEKAMSMIDSIDTNLKNSFINNDIKLELKLGNSIIKSSQRKSDNLLLKIKIPKKIVDDNKEGDVFEYIKQCKSKGVEYEVSAIGMIRKNFKFRELVDFKRLKRDSQFDKEFKESIQIGDFTKIQEFSCKLEERMNQVQKFEDGDLDIPRLVKYSRINLPFNNFKYFGNLLINEEGKWLNQSIKLYTIQIEFGDEVPVTYNKELKAEYDKSIRDLKEMKENGMNQRLIEESPTFHFIEVLKILEKLFELKPIWIRRHILWMIPGRLRSQLRFALPFVSYTHKKGPWRHSFIKFGYDPCKERKSYIYQIESFRNNSRMNLNEELEKVVEDKDMIIPPTLYEYIEEFSDETSEINRLKIGKVPKQLFFDGENLTYSLSFQIGDILDEDVKKLMKNVKIEDEVNIETGWIDYVTLSRIKGVIKYKLQCIRDGNGINEDSIAAIVNKAVKVKESGKVETEEGGEDGEEGEEGDEEEGDEEEGEDEGEDEEHNEDDAEVDDHVDDNLGGNVESIDEDEDVLERLKKYNFKDVDLIERLDGIIQQVI